MVFSRFVENTTNFMMCFEGDRSTIIFRDSKQYGGKHMDLSFPKEEDTLCSREGKCGRLAPIIAAFWVGHARIRVRRLERQLWES